MNQGCIRVILIPGLAMLWAASAFASQPLSLYEEALTALRKAAQFYRGRVAIEGGYHYAYSLDLRRHIGEGSGSERSVTVQPPGTPAVGLAYLRAFQATRDPYYLEGAQEVAACLFKGQLRSGGWDYRIEFDPGARRNFAYRVEALAEGQRNVTTLDDNTTQTAVLFLSRLDSMLGFREPRIREAVEVAMDSLLGAQYPNGAWPQRYSGPPNAEKFPVKKAAFPEGWSRTWPRADYYAFYTFNDNTMVDMIRMLLELSRIYGQSRYLDAARKAADFIRLAQLPAPQPAWAQQYDFEMHPAWARRFEPPAVSGRESQDILLALLEVYRETKDPGYLEPVPRALDYLTGSLLPDGRLARFYELETNRPLYFTREYQLTYSDADTPTHYSFEVETRLDQIRREYELIRKQLSGGASKLAPVGPEPEPRRELQERARRVIESMDEAGRWPEWDLIPDADPTLPRAPGFSSATFIRNMGILCDFLNQHR